MEQHNHDHHHSVKNIKTAFFLNVSFTIVELIGGILTNSLAVLSDAIHDLGDSVSLGISWRLEKVSTRGRTSSFTYGYKRFSLLGAVISSLILIAGSVVIVTEAIPRLFNPETVNARGMFFLAIVGVLVNGIAVLKLKSGEKIHERVVMLHLLEDAVGWVAVLIAGIIIHFTGFFFLDPLLSLSISVFVLVKVVGKLRQSLRIFLQSVPDELHEHNLERDLAKIDDVIDVHDVHLWSLDGNYNICTVHVVVSDGTTLEKIREIKQKVREHMDGMNISHSTIEVGWPNEPCPYKEC